MTEGDDLAWRSATELARLIRDRQLSPVELMDATLARIEARNPSINALVFVDADRARAKAREAEGAVMRGDPLGPLHGVPTALKDLFDFEPGWPATLGGIPALKDFRPPWRCLFAERAQAAGAILVGKTNAPVMGFRGATDNKLFGPSRNPFDTSRNTGGSSGGAAGAVADGLLPFAEGTDGGGSIRIPSAWCGTVGLKPSFGRVPWVGRPNAFGGLTPFLHEGPITRTVEDAALVLDTLAGGDPRDPFAIDQPLDAMAACGRGMHGMRVAFCPDWGGFPVEPEVATVVAEAVRAMADAGAIVEEVRLDLPRPHDELTQLWCRLVIPLTCVALDNLAAAGIVIPREDMPEVLWDWAERGRAQSLVEHHADQALRSAVYDAVQTVLEGYDLLVGPTVVSSPVLNATDGETAGPVTVAGGPVDPLIGWCPTYLLNFTGHPAISVPAGLTGDGLPVGLQIAGRRYADGDVLAAAAAYERARPWSYRVCAERRL